MSTRITEALQEALKLCSLAETMTACRGDDDFIAGVRARIEAALSTEPGEMEGMVLVPREPTLEMIQAWIGYYGGDLGEGFSHQARAVWEAMLAAAPLTKDTHHG